MCIVSSVISAVKIRIWFESLFLSKVSSRPKIWWHLDHSHSNYTYLCVKDRTSLSKTKCLL